MKLAKSKTEVATGVKWKRLYLSASGNVMLLIIGELHNARTSGPLPTNQGSGTPISGLERL